MHQGVTCAQTPRAQGYHPMISHQDGETGRIKRLGGVEFSSGHGGWGPVRGGGGEWPSLCSRGPTPVWGGRAEPSHFVSNEWNSACMAEMRARLRLIKSAYRWWVAVSSRQPDRQSDGGPALNSAHKTRSRKFCFLRLYSARYGHNMVSSVDAQANCSPGSIL